MTPSTYQAAIYDHALRLAEGAAPNLGVEACAGAGKTHTLAEICKRLPPHSRATVVAFGKDVAQEMQKRLPAGRGHRALTAHALCRRAWLRALGQPDIDVDNEKYIGMLRTAVDNNRLNPKEINIYQVRDLVNAARGVGLVPRGTPGMTGLVPDDDRTWALLLAEQDISSKNPARLIEAARRALSVGIAGGGRSLDFQDMLYLPICTDGIEFQRSEMLLVDELQDLDPLQRRMVELIGEQAAGFIGVGDPKQAIFSWRGAGLDAMERVLTSMNCEKLPLSICYRCPSSHIRLAQEYVPQIEARPDAPEGTIVHHESIPLNNFHGGDVVLCRMRAPGVKLAVSLVEIGVPVQVLGRDLSAGIESLIAQARCETLTQLLDAARKRTDIARERAAALQDDRIADDAADRQQVIEAIAKGLSDDSLSTFRDRIKILFSEGSRAGRVTISTIHKFKGGEADRVFWLDEGLCSDKSARTPTGRQEIRNLRYVALTRARSELHFIYS